MPLANASSAPMSGAAESLSVAKKEASGENDDLEVEDATMFESCDAG